MYGVEPICRVLQIAPSTYYAICERRRQPAPRTLRDRELLVEVRRRYDASSGLYGARKVWWQLQHDGVAVARCTVERLMREAGLEGVVRGKARRTTVADARADRPTDLVERDFTAIAPNVLWVADFTYVATWSGVVYVAFVIDAFSRRILGWKADTNMRTGLVLDTLEMALWSRERAGLPARAGLIHHHDNGSQYLSFAFTQRLIDAGVDASVGSVGDALTPWLRRRSACSRPRRSAAKGHGRRSPMSSWRPWNGSTGSTPRACILPAADSPQRSTSTSI